MDIVAALSPTAGTVTLTVQPLPHHWRRITLCLGVVGPLFAADVSMAQMQLPGATAATGEGVTAKPAGPHKPRRAGPPPAPKVPSEEALVGRTLEQNGRAGRIQFGREGKDLHVAHVTLAGEKISRPSEACTIEQTGTPPVPVPAGRPNGVTHYSLPIADCAFEFDILETAILVSARPNVCEFAAADCRIDPAGLWGQPAAEIGAARTKEIERARGPAEQAMRNHFRSWVETAGKDNALVRRISRDQAGFSSRRAEICSRYARESEHGYCSLTITLARSSALAARIAPPDEPAPAEAAKRKP